MILAPLYDLENKTLCKDQILELAFIACFQTSPLVFNKCLTLNKSIIAFDSDDHPFFAWKIVTMELFNSFQGGKFPRFSSCSNSFLVLFSGEHDVVADLLKNIIMVLYEWIDFIDSFHGVSSADEISYSLVEEKMKSIVQRVKIAAKSQSIEFNLFRLSVLTTLVCSLSITIPGPHLNQLIIPCEGTAADNHLKLSDQYEDSDASITMSIVTGSIPCGSADSSSGVGSVTTDEKMQIISSELGFPEYRRSIIEILLCESFAGRELKKKDVFKKGSSMFHLNPGGIPMFKKFNSTGAWIPLRPSNKKYKFINR